MLFRVPTMWFFALLAIAGCTAGDDPESSSELAMESGSGEGMEAVVDPCPEAAQIDALITQLGDPRYAVREAASTALATMCGRYECQERVMPKLLAAQSNADPEIAERAKALRYACAGGCTDSQPPNYAKVNCTYSSNAHAFTTHGVKCRMSDGLCFGTITIKQTCGEPTLQTAVYPGMLKDLNALITCPDGTMRPLNPNFGAGVILGPTDVLERLCPNEPRAEHAASIAAQLVGTTTFEGILDDGMCALGDAPNGCGNSAIAQQQIEAQLQAEINAGRQWCRAVSSPVSGYICAAGDSLATSCPALPPGGGGGGGPGGGGGGGEPGSGSGSGSGG
jgi:hypothetical protein